MVSLWFSRLAARRAFLGLWLGTAALALGLAASVAGGAETPTAPAPAPPTRGLRTGSPALLGTVEAVRHLAVDKVALHVPVALTATVTFVDPIWHTVYVQDATGGVIVRPRTPPTLRAGDRVTITGATETGDPLPVVIADHVSVVGTAAPPLARVFDPARTSRYLDDASRVEVVGVPQHVALDELGHLTAEFMTLDGSPLRITVANRWSKDLPATLVDATVRATGVLSRVFDTERQSRALHLLVASFDDLAVIAPAGAASDAFMPKTTASEHLAPTAAPHRARARGVVTLATAAQIAIEGERGAWWIRFAAPTDQPPALGTEIDATGFLDPDATTPTLRYADVTATGAAVHPVEPVTRDVASLLREGADGHLARLPATFLDAAVKGQEQFLTFAADDVILTATLPLAGLRPLALAPGTRVELTGVSEHVDAASPAAARPRGLRFFLRTDGDVHVLSTPSILTATTKLAGAALAFCLVGAIGWGILLLQRRRDVESRLATAQAHEALLVRQHDELVEHANDLICTWDATGSITTFNRAGERMIGRLRQDVIGRQLSELAPPMRATQVAELVTRSLRANGPLTFEVEFLTPDGNALTVDMTTRPLHEGGEAIQAVGRDITLRKQGEMVLQRAKEAAEAASRTKSDFVANISHEIRTPMNGIIGLSELLDRTTLDVEQRDYVDLLRRSGQSLLRLVNDVLDFSKIEAGRLELAQDRFDLRAWFADAVASLQGQARTKGLTLLSSIDPNLPRTAIGDAGRLQQVLVNLVGNAVKFSEPGDTHLRADLVTQSVSFKDSGDIHLRVKVVSTDDRGCELHLSVQDHGIGIPLDKQAHIFEPFTQADQSTTRRYGGTGLGLAIAASIVRAMNGRIWVESEVGRGSTFHFTVKLTVSRLDVGPTGPGAPDAEPYASTPAIAAPAAPQPAVRPARDAEPPVPLAPPLVALRVLLAEDNQVNQRIALAMLKRLGHRAVMVPNGQAAVEQSERERFDVVLMDVQMPEMSGLDAATAIRRRERYTGESLPIIALTAHAMEGDKERCLAAGMSAYLSKPLTLEALRTALDAVAADILERQTPKPDDRAAS